MFIYLKHKKIITLKNKFQLKIQIIFKSKKNLKSIHQLIVSFVRLRERERVVSIQYIVKKKQKNSLKQKLFLKLKRNKKKIK